MRKIYFILLILTAFLFSGINSTVSAFPFSQKVDSIQIVFDNQQLVLPGESFRIGIISYGKKGKIKKTVGALDGSVWWWKYKVEVSGGTDFSGRISVNEQLVPSKGKYINIKAYPRKQPELAKELLLPLNYETKITYQPTNEFDKSPGSLIKGEVIYEFNNGVTRICKDLRNSHESGFLNFSASGGSWEKGRFTIDPDFRKIENHQAKLVINSLRNKLVADTFAVLLDYKHNYRLLANGSSGFLGSSGMSGSSGSDGQNGQHGEFGYDGPDLNVWADLYRDSLLNEDLLYVFAQNSQSGEEFSYLINPNGGSLEVVSRGGSGGNGGSGGDGGSGIDGQDGEKWIEKHQEKQIVKKPVTKKVIKKEKKKVTDADGKETEIEVDVEVDETTYVDEEIWVEVEVEKQGPGYDGTDGGWGGAGGLGGMGGYGGNITLYLTDDAWSYQNLFIARSEGGSGGMNGSGGSGGRGGSGGHGNPNGRDGANGHSGPSAMGWAGSGGSGTIQIRPTEEFFFYKPKEQAAGK
jgi:hypothetical protein